MELTAHCTRYDGWWIVEVPEIKGLYTQVRRLDQVEDMVLDAATLLEDQPPETYTVNIKPVLDAELDASLAESREGVAALDQASKNAARANRTAVSALRARGLTVRDIATLMGISPQRVSQLAS